MPTLPAALPRLAALSLAVAALLNVPAVAADTGRIDSRIELYAVAGLHVMTIRETLSESPTSYAITMGLQSRGIANLFANIRSRTEVTGRIAGGRLYPQTFDSNIDRGGEDIVTRATFGNGSVLSVNVTPRPTKARTPVTPDQLRGTVDEHTAYYELERQLASTGSCALTVPVFDGLHRFNLLFRDLPPSSALDHPVREFSGPTKGCEVTRQKISGFPIDGDKEGMDHGRMWFARLLPGPFMLPVQMEFDTELGVIRGYLAELHGHGVDLALMK
ncbi:MAG TPA: DUF3108 domain-containing protein [Stellaceae bacterium]|nr:DUF3108 domain-containing protein [Stellaceae bacterium]